MFPVEVVRTGYQLLFFGYGSFHASGPPTWITLPVVFLAVAAVMATIGEGVARTFIRFRPLDAYRLYIAGSIAGIAVFSLLSFLDAKPVVWALVVAAVMLLLYGRRTGLLQVTAVRGAPGPGARFPRRQRSARWRAASRRLSNARRAPARLELSPMR